MNVTRPKILIVDNDAAVLREISETISRRFDTIRQRDAARVLQICDEDASICAIIYGYGSQNEEGVLESMRAAHPMVHRILLSDYTDLSLIVKGLHSGAVQSVIHKPIDRAELVACVTAISQVVTTLPSPTLAPRLSA